MSKINYFCDKDAIEANALEQLQRYESLNGVKDIYAFTDIHYCDEKALPVGVAFSSENFFYPLVTGKDVGCGVMYLEVSKEHWIKPFNKEEHYRALEKAHNDMTDDGLGGGNHFLSLEEDDKNVYIICHTGSRNMGISLFQEGYSIMRAYQNEANQYNQEMVSLDFVGQEYWDFYTQAMNFARNRRLQFCIKTLVFLQKANYINCDKSKIDPNYMKWNLSHYGTSNSISDKVNGTPFVCEDTMHNHLTRVENTVIHRKGSTELSTDVTAVIPLSMTRGSLFVVLNNKLGIDTAMNSCSHGAGRKLSRFDAMKHWRTVMKAKERKEYEKNFSELLDKSGKFPNGYLQEFDYAYKESEDILKYQKQIYKVTQTKPIVTVKFTEI